MIQSRAERRKELTRIAAGPNGLNRLFLILKIEAVPFDRLPIAALMIDAILDHDDAKWKQGRLGSDDASISRQEAL